MHVKWFLFVACAALTFSSEMPEGARVALATPNDDGFIPNADPALRALSATMKNYCDAEGKQMLVDTAKPAADRASVLREDAIMSVEFNAFLAAVAARDAAAISNCFSENALVVDVGRRISGRAAIREWARNEIVEEGLRYQVVAGQKTAGGYSFLVSISSPKFSFRARYELTVDGGLIVKAVLDYA